MKCSDQRSSSCSLCRKVAQLLCQVWQKIGIHISHKCYEFVEFDNAERRNPRLIGPGQNSTVVTSRCAKLVPGAGSAKSSGLHRGDGARNYLPDLWRGRAVGISSQQTQSSYFAIFTRKICRCRAAPFGPLMSLKCSASASRASPNRARGGLLGLDVLPRTRCLPPLSTISS